jgi:NAD(P)-dependent dehydrogenase (short-subunit alcohol dehydrogenase family)
MGKISGTRRKDFNWQRTPLAQAVLNGKKAAVVGGTDGIGRAIARILAAKGAEVTVVGRTFRDKGTERISFLQADLSLMKEARRVARELPAETLDVLVLTTGIFAGKQRVASPEGVEIDLAVSYLSRFVIVRELAERLGKERAAGTAKPRVFIMGFPGTNPKVSLDDLNSEKQYNTTIAHMNTVIGNEALVLDSASRYPQANYFGLNPGLIKSNIRAGILGEGSFTQKIVEALIGLLFKSTDEYAEQTVPLLVSPDIEKQTGAMFNDKGDPILASAHLTTGTGLQRIIEASEQLAKKALGGA